MAITRNPAVGEVLQCDFGDDYPRTPEGEPIRAGLTVNERMPPEMVKNRLVVILNGKMTGGCMVVPVSASKKRGKSTTTSKYHVLIPGPLVQGHEYFTSDVDRWALGEQVQQVSKDRLNPFHPDPRVSLKLPSELVTQIQTAVIKAINAGSLLHKDQSSSMEGAAATPIAAQVPSGSLGVALLAAQAKKAVQTAVVSSEVANDPKAPTEQPGSSDGKEAA